MVRIGTAPRPPPPAPRRRLATIGTNPPTFRRGVCPMRLVRMPARRRAVGAWVAAAVAACPLFATSAAAAPANPAIFAAPALEVSSADACADSEEVGFLALI